jgi:hypothetical protein
MFHLPIYHLSAPEAIQHVLVDNARNYVKGPLFNPSETWSAAACFSPTAISGCASAA